MIEFLTEWVPSIVIGGAVTFFWLTIRRYLKGQDDRYSALAADVKEFSKELIASVAEFREAISDFRVNSTTQHTLCNSRHENTETHLKRLDKDIDDLYTKTNSNTNKITELDTKISK